MAKKQKDKLSHVTFGILTILSEGEGHAYSINQKIEDRGYKAWANIGKSSTYDALIKLKEYGYIESWSEQVDNRERKMYKMTEKGRVVLHNRVFKTICEFGGKSEDFDLAISTIYLIPHDKRVQALNNAINNLRNNIKALEGKLKESEKSVKQDFNTDLFMNVAALFVRPIRLMKTHIEFFQWLLKELEEEKNKYGEQPYDQWF